MSTEMQTQVRYQVIYVGRDQATHVSPRFGTAEDAREYLDTVIIGSGLVVKVFANGDMLADSAANSNGDRFCYADFQH